MFQMDKLSLFSVLNNIKIQPEKQQQKAMALEFKIFFSFLLFLFVYFISFFVLHEELFFACWYITFLKAG